MTGNRFAAAMGAAFVGAALAFGTYGVLDAGGPAGREEATVQTRGQHVDRSIGHLYDLVLRTASGERFEVSSPDATLDLEPGSPVRLEISEVGRSVQAVEARGHRVGVGNSPVAVGIFVALIAVMTLVFTLVCVTEADRPALAALSAAAGFLLGALPGVLLF
ncbi:hypothetical protein ACFVYA_06980 [Amycolatopsis sp. NPDC058278]|uniref:hypothetical protein n=1 Tax=Amycolatopsis sp. NPDC058278 TaxID=3346417 RepID=UPI0036DE0178